MYLRNFQPYTGLINFFLLLYKIVAFCILSYEASQSNMLGDGRGNAYRELI